MGSSLPRGKLAVTRRDCVAAGATDGSICTGLWLEDAMECGVDPLLVFRKISVAFQRGEHRVVGSNTGGLQDRVILQRLGEHFPTDGIDGCVLARINYEWISIG